MKTPLCMIALSLVLGVAAVTMAPKTASADVSTCARDNETRLTVERIETTNGTLHFVRMPNGKACTWFDGGRIECDFPAPAAVNNGDTK